MSKYKFRKHRRNPNGFERSRKVVGISQWSFGNNRKPGGTEQTIHVCKPLSLGGDTFRNYQIHAARFVSKFTEKGGAQRLRLSPVADNDMPLSRIAGFGLFRCEYDAFFARKLCAGVFNAGDGGGFFSVIAADSDDNSAFSRIMLVFNAG